MWYQSLSLRVDCECHCRDNIKEKIDILHAHVRNSVSSMLKTMVRLDHEFDKDVSRVSEMHQKFFGQSVCSYKAMSQCYQP